MGITAKAENERLAVLERYQVFDSQNDPTLDHITELAASVFEVPYAMVTYIDGQNIAIKSSFGTALLKIPRSVGLCGLTLEAGAPVIIENGNTDLRTLQNPMVREMGILFYAGVPVKSACGQILGTFCIADKIPHRLTQENKKLLFHLARLVEHELQQKVNRQQQQLQYHQFTSMLVHSLKNSLTIFPTYTEMIRRKVQDDEELLFFCDRIRQASDHMATLVHQTLEISALQSQATTLDLHRVDLNRCAARVVAKLLTVAGQKDQKIIVNSIDDLCVMADEVRLADLLDNLINNAIKYSPHFTSITITIRKDGGRAVVVVSDEGPGLKPQDFARLFLPFQRLSAQPTGNERSTGIGLATVKMLAEAHQGYIRAVNNENGKGASFILDLPAV